MNNYCKSCSQNTEYSQFITPATQQKQPKQSKLQQLTPQQKFIIQNTINNKPTINKPIINISNNTPLMEYIVQSQHNISDLSKDLSKCSTCTKMVNKDTNSILYYGCGATCTLPPSTTTQLTTNIQLTQQKQVIQQKELTQQKYVIKPLNVKPINSDSNCKTCNKMVRDVQTGSILYYGCGATCTLPPASSVTTVTTIIQPHNNSLYQLPIYYHGCGASCDFPYGSCTKATVQANSNPYFFHNKNKSTVEKYRFIKMNNNPKKVITHRK